MSSLAYKFVAVALVIIIGGAVAVVLLLRDDSSTTTSTTTSEPQATVAPSSSDNITAAPISETSSWPSNLYNRVSAPFLPGGPTQVPWPVTTSEAMSAGWNKSVDEACVPELGEAWLYQGKRDINSSVTLYFSPQVGDEPGVLTGIEADYYGAIPETLIGSYFSEKRGGEGDLSYHSVAVGLRDSNKFDLCNDSAPLSTGDEKYVVIAPTMASVMVPTNEADTELVESFQEGSCIQGMGFHWLKSTVADQTTLDYKTGTTAPVVVMYHPETKDIAGIFFWAPQRMQNWDNQCTTALITQDVPTVLQCMEMMNFWDPGPGLSQENQGRTFMCSNTCDEKCYFEDSVDGILQTMHFFFYPADELICPGTGVAYCRNGVDLFAPPQATAAPSSSDNITVAPISETSWPSNLYNRVSAPLPGGPTQVPWPVTTSEAISAGWNKSVGEACVPELGEAWLYQGKRDINSSVTLYFSPQVGDEPGVLTGIEADYYGAIPETLIGSYFSEKRGGEGDLSYHSVAVGLRDANKFDLCDDSAPLSTGDEKYVVIAPTMASVMVPTNEADTELVESFQEGSCIQGMGFHWLKSTVANQTTLDYKTGTTAPVVVMYHPETKDIAGIFFWAPQRMQNWDNQCTTALVTQDIPTVLQCMEMMNFWDPGPGLSQENQGRTFMCSNTCDEKCYFEDSVDGILQTMHFFFYPAEELICPGTGVAYCRNGVDLFAVGGR